MSDSDMSAVIVAKSDQINADDLGHPITVTIESVSISPGTEQPVTIKLVGEKKFFRPCKTVSRILVNAWGPDAKQYAGRSLTLYRDARVTWGGMEVGGIRVSHMSHIERELVVALNASNKKKAVSTIKPLAATQPQHDTEPFDVLSAGMAVEAALKAVTDKPGLTAAWKANARTLADIKAANGEAHAALERLAKQIAADFDKAADLDRVSDDGRMG